MRPRLGLSPTSPQQAAGMRIEPPPSLPWASGTMPGATAAAAPPEEPPGVRSVSQGLRVGPKRRGSVTGRIPNSGRLVLPTITKPASRRRRTTKASWAGPKSPKRSEPSVYGMPATAAVSLTAIGHAGERPRVVRADGVGGGEGAVGVEVHERVEARG